MPQTEAPEKAARMRQDRHMTVSMGTDLLDEIDATHARAMSGKARYASYSRSAFVRDLIRIGLSRFPTTTPVNHQ